MNINDTYSAIDCQDRWALFHTYVERGAPTACWAWRGSIDNDGYGQLRIGGQMQKAHRLAYVAFVGRIPMGDGAHGVCVLHRCDNPACCNPEHLFLGTHAENMRDKREKGRASRNTHFLTPDQVRAIRLDARPLKVVAAQYGVTKKTITYVRTRRVWANVV